MVDKYRNKDIKRSSTKICRKAIKSRGREGKGKSGRRGRRLRCLEDDVDRSKPRTGLRTPPSRGFSSVNERKAKLVLQVGRVENMRFEIWLRRYR